MVTLVGLPNANIIQKPSKFPTLKLSTAITCCKLNTRLPLTSDNSLTCPTTKLESTDIAGGRKRRVEMGIIGAISAVSVMMGLTLEAANATRIEYYATVSEPSCNLTVVPSGLAFCDIVPGFGDKAPYNELINVHYTARFADETVFDSSYKRGRPLTMRIGVGKFPQKSKAATSGSPYTATLVIKGLDQGIFGGGGVPPMQVGGKRKLRIPPELAYGSEPAGCFSGDCNIPANATLLYEINFVNIYSGNRK